MFIYATYIEQSSGDEVVFFSIRSRFYVPQFRYMAIPILDSMQHIIRLEKVAVVVISDLESDFCRE